MFDIQEWNRMWIDCYTDSWSPENPNANLPKKLHKWAGNKTYVQNTDFWLKKMNFMRLKNLNVSYTIPQSLYKRTGIDRVQLYFVGTNMFMISNFNHKYYDPEMGYGMSFPIMKTYNFAAAVRASRAPRPRSCPACPPAPRISRATIPPSRSEEHTSELQSH